MAQSVADKLDEARALVEKGWTQGHDAVDQFGKDIDPRMDEAACWCINGALFCVAGSSTEQAERFLEQSIGHTGEQDFEMSPVIDWNDKADRTQAEVIDAFKRAAELARGEQA